MWVKVLRISFSFDLQRVYELTKNWDIEKHSQHASQFLFSCTQQFLMQFLCSLKTILQIFVLTLIVLQHLEEILITNDVLHIWPLEHLR